MSEPMRPADLDDLVALLRSAAPSASTLASARADLLESAARAPASGAGLAARIGFSMIALLAIGLPPFDAARSPAPAAKQAGAHRVEVPARSLAPIDILETPEPRVIEPSPDPILAVVPPRSRAPRRARSAVHALRPGSEHPIAIDVSQAPIDDHGKQDRLVSIASDAPGSARDEAAVSAPSEALAQALRQYASERYAEAAALFQRVAEGMTQDAPDRVAQADFFLAKCLYHLGLYHASASAFDEVTQRGSAHPYFAPSLRWLAMLAERVPEPSGVIESIGRYDASMLAALDTAETREHYQHLLYLLGRARYREGRFAEAIELFARVPDGTRWALDARFHEGVSHVRERRAQPAIAAFRGVIDSVSAGRTGASPDARRLEDLAWVSAARLYYSVAMQQPSSEDERASYLLTLAIAAFRRIPLGSEQWLDSFFEETWALYVTREHGRALGHVHALESPYFRDRANPEALVIRAMIFFEHCQWDAAEAAVASFHERYDPIYADAQLAARSAGTSEEAYRLLVALREGRSSVAPRADPALREALADRDLLRHLAQVSSIAREEARLAAMSSPFLETSLGARVAQDLAVQRAFATDRAGELARARIVRVAEELSERMTQMDTVELELATVRREELARPNGLPMGPRNGGRIVAVQGDQIWPWDGEWWRDELPFYVQEIRNRCSR